MLATTPPPRPQYRHTEEVHSQSVTADSHTLDDGAPGYRPATEAKGYGRRAYDDTPVWFRMLWAGMERWGIAIVMSFVAVFIGVGYARWTREDSKESQAAFLAGLESQRHTSENVVHAIEDLARDMRDLKNEIGNMRVAVQVNTERQNQNQAPAAGLTVSPGAGGSLTIGSPAPAPAPPVKRRKVWPP